MIKGKYQGSNIITSFQKLPEGHHEVPQGRTPSSSQEKSGKTVQDFWAGPAQFWPFRPKIPEHWIQPVLGFICNDYFQGHFGNSPGLNPPSPTYKYNPLPP